jgi:hypothetical protein
MREGRTVADQVTRVNDAVTNLAAGRCLNCGAPLHGAFCGACGQRSVPANPTVSELAGDAWRELSGYDGRIAATFRGLLHPGRLTLEYLHGRRARYLSPVRLYLIVSLIYFLIAATAPQIGGGLRIGLTNSDRDGPQVLTEQDRAEMLKDLGDVPSVVRPMVRSIAEDPDAFRARLFAIMPRVFFGMLPVFAAIVALFYRRSRFPAALVFAVHAHAFAFLIFSLAEAAKFSSSATAANIVELIALVAFSVYAPLAQKRVFGGSWPAIVAKSTGIGFLYLLVSVPAFLIILIWASLV